jgi:hypothetical protein
VFVLLQAVREILLVGHRQAFAWIDDWYGMTMDDVREYEKEMQASGLYKVPARCGKIGFMHRDKTRVQMHAKIFPHLKLKC